ncbi:MAG: class I SAM-dependent methyltransferase [Betaproteobacteria bacterium]|nr:class I SAM-dependent methyltransferase [Betaproteobacteria bacterium]
MSSRLSASARAYSDPQWYEMLVASIDNPEVDGIRFPGFPSGEIQKMMVGSAFAETLAEARNFYSMLKDLSAKAGNPVTQQSRFLDFGCGWGRFLRFAWKDVEEPNLHGCDINDSILDVCRETGVPGRIERIEPFGSLPYAEGHFDTVMAYSVFTHLPEQVHLRWMGELARVMRAGGLFFLTLEPRRFMDFILFSETDNPHRMLGEHRANLPAFFAQFDRGEFVFMPTNKGIEDYYGDAVVPMSWIRTHWAPYFQVLVYINDPAKFGQAVLVVRRTGEPFSASPG